MTGIIEEWLFNKVGVSVDLKNTTENNIFKDGSLIFSILQKYGLLDTNFGANLTSSNDKVQCLNNLKIFKPLFDMLKVNYDENVMLNIVENNTTAIYKLLYELYVCFENKQHLHFILSRNDNKEQNNKIDISTLNNDKINFLEYPVSEDTLENESPLNENRDIIDWYRNKYNLMKRNLDLRVNKSKQPTLDSVSSKQTKRKCQCYCIDVSSSYERLSDLDEFSVLKVDPKKLQSYEEFIASYKEKQQKNTRKKCLENDMQHYLLEETWNKIKDKQKVLSNSVFTEITLKQSNYEKQILTKLIQTKQQVKLENEYKIKIDKDICSTEEHHIAMDTSWVGFKEIEKMYLEEQKRVQDLHNKLYKEKQDRKKERRYSLCHDIITELVDLAVLAAKYKEQYNLPVPKNLWNDWMKLFLKGQTLHIPFQQLDCEGSINSELDCDDIINLEKLQDDVLNDCDIDEYLLTCGKWYYKNICLESANLNKNILSYIVSRLLSTKYPPPPSPLPAEIPPCEVVGVLTNFISSEIIDKLNNLLSKKMIHIFNPEIAIKKCIHTHKQEKNPDIQEKRGKSSKHKGEAKLSESVKRGKKDKRNKKSTSKTDPKTKETYKDSIEQTLNRAINLINKETQTSIIGPSVEEKLAQTPLGNIGEKVLNILEEGEQINDDMIVSVIIEYLKSLEGIEGWILVDFPLTLKQASCLEAALSGKYLPAEKYIGQETETDIVINKQNEKIKSRILTLPDDSDKPFKSYFTTFIKGNNKTIEENNELSENNLTGNGSQTRVSNENLNIEEHSFDILEKFYKDQSIFKEFYFDKYDISTLRKLAGLILDVDETSELRLTELFGEVNPTKETKKGKKRKSSLSKSKKSKSSEIKKKHKKGSSLKQLQAEKEIEDIKDSKIGLMKVDQDKISHLPVDQELTKVCSPGDEDWEFISLPIDNELAKILATVWENIENQYLSNLSDLFFENRTINSRLVPYSKYVKEQVNSIREKPDLRQNLIDIFQDNYSRIASNLRTVTQVKHQLHCEVFQLQQNLWKITDDIKDKTESRRQDIIKENWVVNEISLLINNYLSIIQTEYDKAVETLKLINYYYLSMLDRTIPATINIPFGEFNVKRVTAEMFLRLQEETALLLLDVKDSYKEADHSFSSETQGSQDNLITKNLVSCEEPQKVIGTVNNVIIHEFNLVKQTFQNVMNYFYKQINNEAKSIIPSVKRTIKEKSIYSKDQKIKKPEAKKGKEKLSVQETPGTEVSNIQLLMSEWTFVLDNERDEFLFKLDLIEKRASEDFLEFFSYLKLVFCDLYQVNLERYNDDISNINKICDFFKTAIEEESALPHAIILTKDAFFIKTYENLMNKTKYIKGLEEDFHDCYFTIHQLKNLKNIFIIAGPNGIIRKQAFCYIFEDLALFNDKDNQPHLPTMWSQLSDSQLIGVIDSLFGPEYGIDWRDFIIYNLNISFPTIDDILVLRKTFLCYDLDETEIVSEEDYQNIKLWFEEDLPSNPQEGLRLMLVKQLLFELFQIKEKYMKYTSFLLYFCKDFDPRKGLRKALSLSIGKHVIINKEELDQILQEESEILESVTNILSDIINYVVQNREGVQIFEITDDAEFYESEEKSSHATNISSESELISGEPSKQSSIIICEECSMFQNSVPITKEYVPDRWWVSKISVATIESVLNASFRFEDSIIKLYLDTVEDEADSDGTIEGYILMSSSCIQKLFSATKKFMISLPCDILQQQLKAKK